MNNDKCSSKVYDVEVLDNPKLMGHLDATVLYARVIEPEPQINKAHILILIYTLIFLSLGLTLIVEGWLK